MYYKKVILKGLSRGIRAASPKATRAPSRSEAPPSTPPFTYSIHSAFHYQLGLILSQGLGRWWALFFFLWRGELSLVVAVLPEVAVWHEQDGVDSRLAVILLQ